jgi:putative nucleotide binding protein
LVDKKYEDYAIVLDFLPQGSPSDTRPIHLREPVAQVIGTSFFTLLEVVPLKGATLEPLEKINIGKEGRDKVERIRRRIGYEDLTAAARAELPRAIEKIISESPERYVEFFNQAGPVTTRFHQLELIPGIGKKLMWAILEERKTKPFADFKDLEERVKGLSNPQSLIAKRIEMELQNLDKYNLFVRPTKRAERF